MQQRRVICVIAIMCSSWSLFGQTNRYFVSFKDKNNNVFSVDDPIKFLTKKSLDRRAKARSVIDQDDLPVSVAYVNQIRALGVKTFFTSKWWNGVLVQADQSMVESINALPFVSKTELVAPGLRLVGGRTDSKLKTDVAGATTMQTDFQLQQLALDKMHQAGFRGEGITVAQFDSGWQGVNTTAPFQSLFTDGRVKGVFNFVTNTKNVYDADDHGTHVLSVMAADAPSIFIGGCYKANYYLFQTEDARSEYRIEEYNWAFAAERADSLGVDVINSSVGYNTFDDASMNYTVADLTGMKSVVAISARKAIERGMVVVCSAGNEGNSSSWKKITTPADVDGVLAVGSITTAGDKSSFSSIGPTADQRVKPDVVALGSSTAVISSSGALRFASGTSFASPLVASLAVGLVQAFPNAAPSEIVNAIVRSGNLFDTPNNSLGHGVPNFENAKSYLAYGILKEEISILPKPVLKTLNILFKNPRNEEASVRIYNLFGQLIFQATVRVAWDTNPMQIELENLANGIYLLEVKADNKSVVTKIVKTDR